MRFLQNYKNFLLEKLVQSQMPLPEDIEKIAECFIEAGKDIYVVGGSVRDFIQGKTPHDYDLVTNALPNESKEILKDWNVSDEQGKNFGVLRIYTKDCPEGYELAAYRKDISKGRDVKGDEPKVEIGSHLTIEDDVKRRDFTFNALFYDIKRGQIVDLVGGIEDLKNGISRAVGDPKERFNEDRLRILRLLRFTARMDSNIDSITSDAIKSDNRLRGIGPKDDVSQERIIEEWNKTLNDSKKDINIFRRYVNLLFEYDMFPQMFPKMKINPDIKITIIDNRIILYDLFVEMDKKGYMVNKLKFPSDLVNQIYFLHNFKSLEPNIVYDMVKGKERYHIKDELILTFAKHVGMDMELVKSFLKYSNDGFIVSGTDLMEQGFKDREIEIEKKRLETERFKKEYL